MKVYEAKIVYSLVCETQGGYRPDAAFIAEFMKGAFDAAPLQESMWVISLNRKNRPISRTCISLGTLCNTFAGAREIYRVAILTGAASIIIVHNHPGGDPEPSAEDVRVTRELSEAGRIMEIHLLDHVIIGDKADDPLGKGYFSFREAGWIPLRDTARAKDGDGGEADRHLRRFFEIAAEILTPKQCREFLARWPRASTSSAQTPPSRP